MGRYLLSGKSVFAIMVVCIIAGPILFLVNIFQPTLFWSYGALVTLIIVWTIQRSKIQKNIFPLQAVPVTEPVCIGCSRRDRLSIIDFQFHYLDVEKLPAKFAFFDGVINEYGHAGSQLLSICNRCVIKSSKREMLYVGISSVALLGISYMPLSPYLPVLDVLIRGTIVYVLAITAYYYLQILFPWRSWSEEVALEMAEEDIQVDHPEWEVRSDYWYRRNLKETVIQPVLDEDDEFLPVGMGLVAAHVMAVSIWMGLSIFGIEPWFYDL